MPSQALVVELRLVEGKLQELHRVLDRLPETAPQHIRIDLEYNLFSLVNYAQLLRDLLSV